MTTFLLSGWIDALSDRHGWDPLPPLPVHSESPFLLTKSGPPLGPRPAPRPRRAAAGPDPLGVRRWSEGHAPPESPRRTLYRARPFPFQCYPEGNFDENQLLGDSIGLSPLSADLTSDLHVSTDRGLHRGFPRLRPIRA